MQYDINPIFLSLMATIQYVSPRIQLSIFVTPTLAFSGGAIRYFFAVGFCFRFAFCPCHAFHIMSSCASHLHTCSSYASEHFSRCLFCNPILLRPPAPSFVSFHERVLNVLGIDRDLPSGLGTPPVRLMLQRLTGEPQRPRVCCSPTPLQNGRITHPIHSYVLRRRITIVWAKTTPYLDIPTSVYLYICLPPKNLWSKP